MALNKNIPLTCTPVSSNCVVWDGPDLPCISLCKGDNITNVLYNLGTLLCNLQSAGLDLSGVDLQCLGTLDEVTLTSVLNLYASKICELEDLVNNQVAYQEPILTLPGCFQYTDTNNQLVTQALLTNYVALIGNKVCVLESTVTVHNSQIASLQDRVTTLESSTGGTVTLPTIVPVCVSAPVATPIQDVLSSLESLFCQYTSVLGTSLNLAQASQQQCTDLSSQDRLSGSGTMAAIPGWKSTINNLSDSLNNLWLTICDMRTAVEAVANCCTSDCSDIIIDFTVVPINSGTGAELYFSQSTVPNDFTNCPSLDSILTVTDGMGGIWVGQIDLASAVSNPTAVVVDFGASLNPNMSYTYKLESCLTNGISTCQKVTLKSSSSPVNSCGIPQNLNVEIL